MAVLVHYLEVGRMDELGRMDSPIHRLDARAKLVTTAVFLVTVMSFPRYEVSALMPLFFYPAVLIARAGLPAGYLLRKVAVVAPFALMIGLFNPLLDRQPVAQLGSLTLSGGWVSLASILLRFVLTVIAALVLVSCTGIHRLGAGLEQLGLPRVLTVQILFLYRYFFVVGDEAMRMMRGVAMRSVGTRPLPWRVFGTLVGHLLLRAMDRANRVYRAMLARGFDGTVRVLHPTTCGWRDAAFVAGWTLFFVAARRWNLAEALGGLLQ
jgi:cobalt/nickel transport system permease protein